MLRSAQYTHSRGIINSAGAKALVAGQFICVPNRHIKSNFLPSMKSNFLSSNCLSSNPSRPAEPDFRNRAKWTCLPLPKGRRKKGVMKRTSKRFPALLRVGSNLIPVVMTMVIALGWWQPAYAVCPGVTVPEGFDCQVFVDPAGIRGAVTGMTFDSLGNLYTTGFNQTITVVPAQRHNVICHCPRWAERRVP